MTMPGSDGASRGQRACACIGATLAAVFAASAAADLPPFTAEDLARVSVVSDLALSPKGDQVVAVVAQSDLAKNRRVGNLWLFDVTAVGRAPVRLTEAQGNDSQPSWNRDGTFVYFISNRSGSDQVWRVDRSGGGLEQVSNYPLSIRNLVLSPEGGSFAFSAEVHPDCGDLQCAAERLADRSRSNVGALVYDRLYVRYFNRWLDGRQSAIFVQKLNPQGRVDGDAIKVTAQLDIPAPTIRNERGSRWIVYDPAGEWIYFSTLNAVRDGPWSVNDDVYRVSAGGGPVENLTQSNPFYDAFPVVSPDGSSLAYLSADTYAGRVAARHVKVRDLGSGATRRLSPDWPESVDEIVPDACTGDLLLLVTENQRRSLWRQASGSSAPVRLTHYGSVRSVEPGCRGTVLTLSTDEKPDEIYVLDKSGKQRQLSDFSGELLKSRRMAQTEAFSFAGWRGDTVHARLTKPVNFDDGGKHPLLLFVHGGPYQSHQDQFLLAWNTNAFAGMGYAFLGIDFHNSVGYGEDFAESGRGHWDTSVVEDLKKGLAAALERFPWLDANRVCAIGASFGGLYVNWMAGNWQEPFRCFVSHGGMFEVRTQTFSMDNQLTFESGMTGTYFDKPDQYHRINPANFVQEWSRPMMITHGQLDYRVPVEQGLAAFGALQRLGVPSRLLVFPDEGHWIQKPANSLRWYQEVERWLDQWLMP